MAVEIKRVVAGEEALFDQVADDVFDEPVDTGLLQGFLAEPSHHLVVALSEGEVVGQVTAIIHRHPARPAELYIDEVAVTPALQRRGIARAMLEEMMALGRALGCRQAWLATEADNEAARALYASLGCREQAAAVCAFDLALPARAPGAHPAGGTGAARQRAT